MKSSKNPNIAILIVNYKTKKYIIDLLESYILYETYEGKVVFYIGDNASGENLKDIKTLFPILNIKTYQILENRGFGAGNNYLFQYTTEEILFLINPDIIWKESTISKLVQNLRKNNAHVIGPKLINPEGIVQKWDHGELSGILTHMSQFFGSSYWKEQRKLTQVAWVSGAALMIKRDVFQKIGGFDEEFFLYREEEDLCIRIRQQGGKIYYDPSVSLHHIGSVISKAHIHAIKSHDIYLKKHHPILYKIGLSTFLLKMYYRFF